MSELTIHALKSLEMADVYPYDGDRPMTDWAHRAARGVIADLQDRSGIKFGFSGIDVEIQYQIVDMLAEIIRTAWVSSLHFREKT